MELREAYKVTRSNVIPMVLFAAIVISLGINTPQAANEIIARLFNKSISNTELQPSQADVDRFQSILTDKSEKEVRTILTQRALGNKITESVLADFADKNAIEPNEIMLPISKAYGKMSRIFCGIR